MNKNKSKKVEEKVEKVEKVKEVKKVKKKIKKNITNGIAYVKATFNNTIITIADDSGNVISWSSAGSKGFKGFKPKKLDFTSTVDNNELPKQSNDVHTSPFTQVDIPGTSNSVNASIDHSTITDDITTINFPVRLQNEGVNVCFFNAISQVLYSLPQFHLYLDQTVVRNNTVTALKNLFQKP